MKRLALLLGAASVALGSASLAVASPEDLLPKGFGAPPPPPKKAPEPAPAPAPAPAPGNSTTRPDQPDNQVPTPPAAPGSSPVIQPLPGIAPDAPTVTLPEGFPSLAELERMESDEVNQILGLKPKFDIPPAARRAMQRVGVIGSAEGAFHSASLSGQPAALVRAALRGSDGPVISRWGHILMRRALASRLDAPEGMSPAEFAALRAHALNGMGEATVARALVQDVDGNNYNRALTDAALDAYLATGDVLGMCPIARLRPELREDGEWELLQAICLAYVGEARSAERRLQRALGTGVAPEIDVRLAQRYAGAAGEGRRAVNIEWDGVDELTDWRFALARALGADVPEGLRNDAPRRFDTVDVMTPATPLLERVSGSDWAGARGVLSSSAMVDLYAQLYASDAYSAGDKAAARNLRAAYVGDTPAARLQAMQQLWDADAGYGRQVLTAYAAARFPVDSEYADDAPRLIASMLAAGLDRNALRWADVVDEGSEGWALLALARPTSRMVDRGDFDSFVDDDNSADQRKSAFLLAGLAGLGRLESDDISDFSERLNVNFARRSAWSDRISRAGELNNQTLVALLAGLGMQGTDWDRMTARHLFHIVRALNNSGLSAEARMIAAEAVARA